MNEFQNITDNMITKQDLVYFLDDISQAQNVIYEKEQDKLSKKTKNLAGKDLRDILKKQEQKGNLRTREQQEKFLEQLRDYVLNLPQVQLVLAFSPSDNFLKEISQWLENEIKEKPIINLTVNRRIVGGAIIEYQGRYLNTTLKKKIQKATHE